MLTLPIKKKWYDMILSGEKKEEYREIKPYYESRLEIKVNFFKEFEDKGYYVLFRNGYSLNSPTIECKVRFAKGYGKEEWGAEPNKLYYVLKILSVEEVKDNGQ